MYKKWKKGGNVEAHKEKQKDDLYLFKKTVKHGFPYHPSSLAHDPVLKIMAIGNKSGEIKVFGAPGVEFSGVHKGNNQVLQLHFIHGEGKLVSILDDSSIHLWQFEDLKIGGPQQLKLVKSAQLAGRPGSNQVTIVVMSHDKSSMWVGSEGGTIYKMSLPDLIPIEQGTIHQDQIVQSISDKHKTGKALGSVEAIAPHPTDPNLMLIGYNRGLIALWNCQNRQIDTFFPNDKTLEAVAWNSNCEEFMSAHSDGYLCNWRLDSSSPLNKYAPYGPFPCKPITKVMWKSSKSHAHVVFQGGMPRANYGDRHCISVIRHQRHVTFDFTSRIVDFFIVSNNPPSSEYEEAEMMVVLADEELVVIDVSGEKDEDWKPLIPPYLASPHASAITCSQHVCGIPQELFNKILLANDTNSKNNKSTAEWPINGGVNLRDSNNNSGLRSLLLTGHEDGTVKIWEVSDVAMWPVLKIQTSTVFVLEAENDEDGEYGEEFPPFRRIGEFDPYSDDPRLAIRKVAMCPVTGTVVAGGTAGQVVVLSLSQDAIETVVPCTNVDVLASRSDFTWKGHEKLDIKTNHISMKPGYQATSVLQCDPPASITALSLNANWGLVGVGTSHGFALFDYLQSDMVVSRCTLEAGEQLSMEGSLSRVRSLKMSIRQSMRRIGSSFRGANSRRGSVRRNKRSTEMSRRVHEANAALVDEEETQGGWSPATTGHRRIEARSVDDGMTGMVRCTYFATTYLRDAVTLTPTFWAGTNSGSVYCYALHIPDYSKRHDHQVSYVTGKLIQLKHRAPVIDITVMGSDDKPAASPHINTTPHFPPTNAAPDKHKTNHQPMLVISSEEQIKLFSLPKFTPKKKLKITACDGSLIRKVNTARFTTTTSQSLRHNDEYNLVFLTNIGEVHIFNVPTVRMQQSFQCLARDNLQAVASTILTSDAQGLYLSSQCEFERFTLSPSSIVQPSCRLSTATGDVTKHVGDVIASEDLVSAHHHDDDVTNNIITSSPPDSTEAKRARSPSNNKKPPSSSSASYASSSLKTPLLRDHDDDDDDDDDHVNKHERR